ncbi:hypothetical protein [Paenibacillus bouchesdurhonensis]|uniref:hypothetical protein n=1 Tax=Paenibacillus bouchesdurhonensis TaxID=1870990 RepID=UPI000DA5F12D|nr:hypothetical protein [Paenibacillus bouchesdurhonensis]
MKPWMKRFILVFMSLIMLWGVSGCMNKKPNREAIIDRMIAHLEEKYGEEFVPLSFSSSNWAYGHDTLYAYPKKGSENDGFEVWGTKKDDGTYAIRDGYFGIYIKPEYEAVLSSFVSEILDEFKLYTDLGEGVLPDRLNKDTKIEDIYNKDELFTSDTILFVNQKSAVDKDINESLREIGRKMQEKKLVGSIDLFLVKENQFESIGLEHLNINPVKKKEYFTQNQITLWVKVNSLEIKEYGEWK